MRRDPHHFLLLRWSVLLVLAISLASCTNENSMTQPPVQELYTTPTGLLTANPPEIFVGAGDISSCGTNNDEATARLLDTIPGTVYVLGDNVYENGSTAEFNNCYHPTWGRHRARTKPSAGNHEYNTSGAAPYFAYFGAAAGDPSKGYYSYDLGAWHIIVLNSNIARSPGSAQDLWLQNDLATHPNLCTLAYWHHALYGSDKGSGTGGTVYNSVRPYLDRLYPAGADLVLSGHRHFYERLAPMKADGSLDNAFGVRQFIAGAGGIGGATITTNLFPTSEAVNGATRGVLKLYLYDDSYAWKFIPIAGQTFTDSGSTACHGPPGSGGGGVSASLSTVAASPSSFTAGSGLSTITITVNNSSGSPISGANVVVSATGTGNTLTPSSGATNSSGVFTSTLTSTGAGSKTVSASANGIGIIQTAPVTVTAGPISGTVSTVTASPTSFVAGAGSSTITVTARDANGNLISNAAVVLGATGGGNTLSPSSGSTNSSGVFTSTLSSTVAELKTVTATIAGVTVTPSASVDVTTSGGGGGTITQTLLTSGGNGTNQSSYTTASISPTPNALITVAVVGHRSSAASASPTVSGGGMSVWSEVATITLDNVTTPHKRMSVFRAMSVSPGSGPITITFSTAQSNAVWIVSQWTGVDPGGTNGSGAIAQAVTSRSDNVTTIGATLAALGSPSNVAYGVVGTNGTAIGITPGAGFTEIAEQSSNESPRTILEAQWAANNTAVSGSWSGAFAAAILAIEVKAAGGGAPTVSASQSTVTASPPSIIAGSATSTITVTAKDGSGNPMSGISVNLTVTGGSGNSIGQPVGTTGADGVATGTLNSTGAGPKTVIAVAGGVTLNQQPVVTVNVGPPDATQSTVSASPTSIVQTTGTSTITVTVKDVNGNPVSGSSVLLGASGTGNSFGQPGLTNPSGVTMGTLSSTDLQTESVTATADGVLLGQQPSVTITPPIPIVSASLSTVETIPTSFTAGGSSSIKVTVKDGSGSAMSGISVTLSVTGGGGNSISQPLNPTDGSGVTTGTLSSTGAGQKTVTAVAGGVTLDQQPLVTVTVGAPDAGQSTVAVSPASIPVTSGTSNITVTVKDAFGNPVSGSNVVLSALPTTGNSLLGGGLTSETGVATGTLSSTVAETKTVSATADGTPITQTQQVTVTPPGSSTIAHALLTAGTGVTNAKIYTTATIAAAANALVTIAVVGHQSAAASATPTVTGGGMSTWVEVATITFDNLATPKKRMSIFRAMSASPGSGPITITFPTTESNASWIVSQWTGVDQSGMNGSGAIAQALTNRVDAATSVSATLAALGGPSHVAYGVVGTSGSAIGISPGAGFTEISEQKPLESPHSILQAQWAANNTLVSGSWTGSFAAAILAIEIKAAP